MPTQPKIRAGYDKVSPVRLICRDPSRAKQSFSNECDINKIMERFEKDGVLEHVNHHQGQYGDFLGVQPYNESLNQVMAAQGMFNSLPANIRTRFDNDPAKFLDFVADPENIPEMREIGLLQQTAHTHPDDVPSVDAPEAAETPPEAP